MSLSLLKYISMAYHIICLFLYLISSPLILLICFSFVEFLPGFIGFPLNPGILGIGIPVAMAYRSIKTDMYCAVTNLCFEIQILPCSKEFLGISS